MKKIWPWLGDQKNHNALMFIVTFIAVIFAFPYFSNQINNVEIKVDSIETSLREIYGRQMRETFTYSQIKESLKVEPNGLIIKLSLNHLPIKESVNIWWGAMNLNPQNYKVENQEIILTFKDVSLESFGTHDDENVFYVTYISGE